MSSRCSGLAAPPTPFQSGPWRVSHRGHPRPDTFRVVSSRGLASPSGTNGLAPVPASCSRRRLPVARTSSRGVVLPFSALSPEGAMQVLVRPVILDVSAAAPVASPEGEDGSSTPSGSLAHPCPTADGSVAVVGGRGLPWGRHRRPATYAPVNPLVITGLCELLVAGFHARSLHLRRFSRPWCIDLLQALPACFSRSRSWSCCPGRRTRWKAVRSRRTAAGRPAGTTPWRSAPWNAEAILRRGRARCREHMAKGVPASCPFLRAWPCAARCRARHDQCSFRIDVLVGRGLRRSAWSRSSGIPVPSPTRDFRGKALVVDRIVSPDRPPPVQPAGHQ
jgi:hypothetical protein